MHVEEKSYIWIIDLCLINRIESVEARVVFVYEKHFSLSMGWEDSQILKYVLRSNVFNREVIRIQECLKLKIFFLEREMRFRYYI